mgnify:CR=1 FL=1
MSMAVHKGTPQGWGGCIAYGPPFAFGLPVDVPQDRPMVIAHPAAAAHHHASFGLVADGGHPFIHVLAEHGEFTPDGWGINANVAGMATWPAEGRSERSGGGPATPEELLGGQAAEPRRAALEGGGVGARSTGSLM